jgi:DNA uptake protein ComE-like DNA-binding protein
MRGSIRSSLFVRLLTIAAVFVLGLSSGLAQGRWRTFNGCKYLANAANDGDSFHVKAGEKEYIFRLYFVDAPETDTSIPERVREQAHYFSVSETEALMLGQYAKLFSKEKLSRPFTVRTCMEDARGRSNMPRFYAFIGTDSGDLGEQLVTNGLGRVYGAASTPTNGSASAEWQKLEALERHAKEEKVGGWGAGVSRLGVRSKTAAGGGGSFDQLFHKTESPAEPVAAPKAGARTMATSGAARGKLNVNTATQSQLEQLPDLGPALAGRIIAARPFANADALRSVKGIGPVVFEKIRPYFE